MSFWGLVSKQILSYFINLIWQTKNLKTSENFICFSCINQRLKIDMYFSIWFKRYFPSKPATLIHCYSPSWPAGCCSSWIILLLLNYSSLQEIIWAKESGQAECPKGRLPLNADNQVNQAFVWRGSPPCRHCLSALSSPETQMWAKRVVVFEGKNTAVNPFNAASNTDMPVHMYTCSLRRRPTM